MNEILKRILLENQELILNKKLVHRKIHIVETDNITVLTGIRRCGKTYTLYEIAQSFDSELILFLDFEDERLIALNSLSDYDVILDSYKILFPDKKPILFFDEIQNLNNWHFYLKRLHVQGYKIYVTGSNANMISREIATYLKGRSIEINIYPFSFNEFLQLKKIKFQSKDVILNQPSILNAFEEYLTYGGFPEVIKANLDDKRTIAKNIYNLLFYKDLVAKYDKDDYLLKLVVSKIAENLTKEFSISSLAKKIMALHKTSIPTVTEYFNILHKPFLTNNIYPFRESFLHRESKRKTYFADNSFIFLNRVSPDKSRLFENLIFIFLIKKYEEVFYYKTKNNKEVDFYVNANEDWFLIQVAYSIENNETRDREVKSLLKAMEEQNLSNGTILTYNHSEELNLDSKVIHIIPFWKVLLRDFI